MLINIYKFIFSYLYFVVSSFYSFLFKINVLKTKKFENLFVVSVGNLTAGGSGKTPFIILLSKILSKQNIKHAVVSRGYKKNISRDAHMLPDDKFLKYSPDSFGDEPFMLFKVLKTVPVFVGHKVRSLLKMQRVFKGGVALIDDGYQTYELFKDINILLLDCSLDISSYKLLPLGLLREPLKEIKRADVVVLTKTNLTNSRNLSLLKKSFNRFINTKKQAVFSSEYCSTLFHHKLNRFERVDFNSFSFDGEGLVSLCGIANPFSFKSNIDDLNIKVLKRFVFSNHYKYSLKNTKGVVSFCLKNNVQTIITTKKDFYKIKPFFEGLELYILDVEHRIYEYDKLVNYLAKEF